MATNYVGVRTATQAPAATPTTLTDITISLPQDADAWTIGNFYQLAKALADYTSMSQAFIKSIFGDGSDGNVTVSTTVSLTTHKYYDTLTVAAGADLQTNGWRIYCRTGLVWTGGKISCNGAAGSAGSGGTGGAGGQTKPSTFAINRGPHMPGTGGNGGTGAANGTASANVGTAYSNGGGGAGGNGTGGANTGGAAGFPVGYDARSYRIAPYYLCGASGSPDVANSTGTVSAFNTGSGGGGGAGATSNGGGGGGETAGTIIIIAANITVSGSPTCEAIGGVGGAAQGGNAGGGGGGSGAMMVVVTILLTGALPTLTRTAGAGGAGAGTGSAGSAGISGIGTVTHLVCG